MILLDTNVVSEVMGLGNVPGLENVPGAFPASIQKPTPAKRGPKAEVFAPVGGLLEQAIDSALAKKKPATGWQKQAEPFASVAEWQDATEPTRLGE